MSTFFVEDLVESLLGSEIEDVPTLARKFISDEVIDAVEPIREAFHASKRVKAVCLERVLRSRVAASIDQALHGARFKRHHHAAYKIEISAVDQLRESALRKFCRWLATDDAARFHGWLAGWPPDGRPLFARQVQVARARKGDEFPVHVDMDEEGLAAVYNFSEAFGPRDGGELYFPGTSLVLPPIFNTMILFRPRNAPHGVAKVLGPKTRFSVTAFFAAE
ncbi:MAG: 2OG-Fe(II) oxygenase [Archangium sp.]|nr:2OG-Fe(II) oxygenase [Archangium sp.]